MMMRDDKAFIDTNILLRTLHEGLPLHQEAYNLVRETRKEGFELWINRQVIREYLVQITRPGLFAQPFTGTQAITQVARIQQMFLIADETAAVTEKLLVLLAEYSFAGKQIHDASIVASMLAYDIDTLLTQNVKDMVRFTGKIKLRSL